MRLLPGVLKELSKHVPTVLFQTVEWSELASELPKITRRILQKEGYQDLFDYQKDFLSAVGVELTKEPVVHASMKNNKAAGETLLKLYFTQLFSPYGLFLDLRGHHFVWENSSLKWHPSGFWTKFGDNFRHGLLQVYEGFYLEDEKTYYQGLAAIGLISPDWHKEDIKKLGDLFKAQFGSAMDSEMSFELDHFKQSILKTSNFLLEKKVKISKDFLYLGIYLVTLYSSLDETKEKLPVRDIYLEVRKNFEN
ncbi:MAG TPA: hypothetical protein VNJ01_03590 [Bacteriovoracaceae bacterium]|nr:hypothetical protein [Bacteriovoracaceae bacterium]